MNHPTMSLMYVLYSPSKKIHMTFESASDSHMTIRTYQSDKMGMNELLELRQTLFTEDARKVWKNSTELEDFVRDSHLEMEYNNIV